MTFKILKLTFISLCVGNMLRYGRVLAAASIVVAVGMAQPLTVIAEELPGIAVGDKHSNTLTIGEKQIPLPPGEWEVIASQSKAVFTTGGSPIGDIAEIYLARREKNQVTMALFVRTNPEQVSASGWVRNRSVCDRKNVHFNESDRNYNTAESECWQINHIVNTTSYTDTNVARQAFKSFQRTEFGTTTAIASEFWVNDKYDMLYARYYLLPVRYGFASSGDLKWKSSEWQPEAIRDDAKKKRFVAAAKAFAEKLYPFVKQGFRNKIGDTQVNIDFVFGK